MAVPNTTITKNIALAPDGWRRTAYPDGSVPNAGPSAPPGFTTSKTSYSITATITSANGATSYAVSVDGVNFVNGLTIDGLAAGQTYPFYVKGINDFGEAISNPVNVTTNTAGSTGFTGAKGEIITLAGSGFGAIANPRPSAYDNMDTYASVSNGALLPEAAETGARWDDNGDAFNAAYEFDTAVTLGDRQVSALARSNKAALLNLKANGAGPARQTTTGYTSFWFRFNQDLTSGQPKSLDAYALKLIRYWDDPSQNRTRYTFEARKAWCTCEDASGNFLCPLTTDGTLVSDPSCNFERYTYPSSAPFSQSNQWHKAEFAIYGPNSGEAFLDGKRVKSSGGLDLPVRKSPDASSLTYFTHIIGCDLSSSSDTNGTLRQWISDVYEGATPARVEFSADPAWNGDVEQPRFYQEVTSWTDTEIVVGSAFYGTLNTASPIYAHIIKADGTVINWGQIN